MTVDEAYRKWQNEYWFDSRNILEKTINGYISMFDRHIIPIIGKEDISSIDCTKIQKHYDELSENGYSAKTIRNIHQAKRLFRQNYPQHTSGSFKSFVMVFQKRFS